MKVYMYDDVPNFGDILNKHLWHVYFGPYLERDDDILLFGIGTLLGQKIEHEGQVIVCGSGCGYEPDVSQVHKKNWHISFVRGPRTAKLLNLDSAKGITDPAILTPDIFPAKNKTSKVIFIPHHETSLSPLWQEACRLSGIEYIDPLSPIEDVAAAISSSKLVIAEAMHGAIIADSYRVPWLPVATSPRINQFKWLDWTESLNLPFNPKFLPPLGYSDSFRILTADSKTRSKLFNTLEKSEVNEYKNTFYPQSYIFNLSNKLYCVLPRWFRYKTEYKLLHKIGPKLDYSILNKKSDAKFNRISELLVKMSSQNGYLSENKIAEEKKCLVKEALNKTLKYL